jgi:hypothetical protein
VAAAPGAKVLAAAEGLQVAQRGVALDDHGAAVSTVTCASRRKLRQPLPPAPAAMKMRALS